MVGLDGRAARLDRLADRLVTYRHEETGRELVDVPDGLFPDPDVPAPVRFLPEFDDALLSHADSSRIVPPDLGGGALVAADPRPRPLLVDGMVAGLWSVAREPGRARLVLRPLTRWTRAQVREARAEAAALLALLAPGNDHDVEVVQAPGP